MFDFYNSFDRKGFEKLLLTLSSYKKSNLYYAAVGSMVEKGLEEYSNGLLQRINGVGKDLLDRLLNTYESKVIQYKNKRLLDVRGVILKNNRGKSVVDFVPADYYIFTDVVHGRACCVEGSRIKVITKNDEKSAEVRGNCDCKETDFFLNGYNLLEGQESKPIDYFKDLDNFENEHIRSLRSI